jgi:hypothetical protein
MAVNALQSRFAPVAKRIRSDFEASKNTHHRGSRGTEREEIFAKFLELYVPGTVEVVHNAEIVTATGEVSGQCDIVIVDQSAPRIQDLQSHRVVPAECIFGVVEVKSRLTGPELIDSCAKIAKVKRLTRTAYAYHDSPTLHPQRSDLFRPTPIFGYVFAFEGIQLKNLGKKFWEWCKENPRAEHPDGAWIADSGMIVWGPSDGFGSWYPLVREPQIDREIRLLGPMQDGDVLLGMIMSVCSLLTSPLPPLDLAGYLSGGVRYWVLGRESLLKQEG